MSIEEIQDQHGDESEEESVFDDEEPQEPDENPMADLPIACRNPYPSNLADFARKPGASTALDAVPKQLGWPAVVEAESSKDERDPAAKRKVKASGAEASRPDGADMPCEKSHSENDEAPWQGRSYQFGT